MMGWIIFDSRLNESDFLLSAGKILFVCQHFEAICKSIVTSLCLSKALHESQFKFLSDRHVEYVDKLHALLLGQSIKHLNDIFSEEFEPEDLNILRDARDARNYFCHELTLDLVFAPFGRQYRFDPDIERIRTNLRRLTLGDYMVSRWSYEFEETESGSFKNRDAYLTGVETWVMGESDKL